MKVTAVVAYVPDECYSYTNLIGDDDDDYGDNNVNDNSSFEFKHISVKSFPILA